MPFSVVAVVPMKQRPETDAPPIEPLINLWAWISDSVKLCVQHTCMKQGDTLASTPEFRIKVSNSQVSLRPRHQRSQTQAAEAMDSVEVPAAAGFSAKGVLQVISGCRGISLWAVPDDMHVGVNVCSFHGEDAQ